MDHYVYQLVDSAGVPFYVGAASTEHRARGHLSRAMRGGKDAIARKIRDLGGQFCLQKLIEGISLETARWWERHMIETTPGLVNSIAGGGGPAPGWRHSLEAREKIAASNRGLKKSPVICAKIAVKARERRHSPERLAKFSETLVCPHCKKMGGRAGMQRWHLDRCSSRS